MSGDPPRIAIGNMIEVFEKFKAERSAGWSKNTGPAWDRAFKSFLLFTGGKSIDHPVGSKDWAMAMAKIMNDWSDHLLSIKLAPVTTQMFQQKLRSVFRWIDLNGWTDFCPNKWLKTIRIPERKKKLVTYDEYCALRDNMARSYYRWAVVCAYHTGMAASDVYLLKWAEVDMDNLVITRVRKKMIRFGKPCIIPIVPGSDLYEWLKIMRENAQPDAEYVCPALANLMLYSDPKNVYVKFSASVNRVLPGRKITFHCFRHTFVSNIANSGMNLAVACAITGHSSPDMFKKYVKPNIEALRKGIVDGINFGKEMSRTG